MKKHNAQHITVFAVYKKFKILGRMCRSFKIAFPNLSEAEEYVKLHADGVVLKTEDFMIEEMPAIMKAWQP